jgi:O-succinylbenzoate synthase
MKATFQKYILNFKQPSGTSRGVLRTKDTYFLFISDENNEGIGECGLFRGLSIDDRDDYEEKLQWLCDNINLEAQLLLKELSEFPSIQFGLEQALLSLKVKINLNYFHQNFQKVKIQFL